MSERIENKSIVTLSATKKQLIIAFQLIKIAKLEKDSRFKQKSY